MRAPALPPALALLLVLAGCATTPEQVAADRAASAAAFADATAGRVAGKPRQCLPGLSIEGPQIIGDDTLLYRESGRRIWVSRAEACPSLRGDPIVITEIYGGQTCRNDRFRTVPRGGLWIASRFCRFGAFTPYEKPRS